MNVLIPESVWLDIIKSYSGNDAELAQFIFEYSDRKRPLAVYLDIVKDYKNDPETFAKLLYAHYEKYSQ